jgi:hypothetical protein
MALRRIMVRQKLLAMQVDLREQMVYHSPPGLGALWSCTQNVSTVAWNAYNDVTGLAVTVETVSGVAHTALNTANSLESIFINISNNSNISN